ncbi:MAG: hypothetical protein OXI95_15245 [bacterium]|nr:hypothetical protein [bacterium]
MPVTDNLSQFPVAFVAASTLVEAIGISLSSWVVSGLVSELQCRPKKNLMANAAGPLSLSHR